MYDNDNIGRCVVFKKNYVDQNEYWNETQILIPSDGTYDELFGISVSISDNSEYIIIGAYFDDTDENGVDSGSVYIYELNVNTNEWIELQKLIASNGDDSDHFGFSVDIFDKFAIVGARFKNDEMGSAYVFMRNDTTGL